MDLELSRKGQIFYTEGVSKMSGLMIGMISYLPDDEPRRSIRWKQTIKTIKNVCMVASWIGRNLDLAITNWKEKEFKEAEGLNISFHTIPLEERGVAKSRNTLLKAFYDSDFDYLLMCDDDIAFYPHYDIENFFHLINEEPQRLLNAGLYYICAVLASYAPYKEKNMNDRDFENNWVFTAGGNTAGMCPQIFVNLKKYFDTEIYQKEVLNKMGMGGDDTVYTIELMEMGLMPYTLTSLIAGTTEVASTAWEEKKSKQEMLKQAVWEEGQPTLDWLIAHYPKLRQRTKYKLDFSGYYPKHEKRLLVPRDEQYVFKKKDIVIKRQRKVDLGLLKK